MDNIAYYGDIDDSDDEQSKPILTNKEYSDEFHDGFRDGKKSQGITVYPPPVHRTRKAYQMTKVDAYRQGFNLALMGVMMQSHDNIDRNREWFRWYCHRMQNNI